MYKMLAPGIQKPKILPMSILLNSNNENEAYDHDTNFISRSILVTNFF